MNADKLKFEEIKYRLRVQGISIADIARSIGVDPSSVTKTGLRQRRSARIEAALAEALDTTPQELFLDLKASGEGSDM